MEDNDISPYITSTVAVMFEGIITLPSDASHGKKKFWQRPVEVDRTVDSVVRSWRVNELPLKSLIHMVNQLQMRVDVYTYYDSDYTEAIEHWLARKGVSVSVYSYEDLDGLRDDFKYNRDVHTLYTPFEEDAALLGPRATVMSSLGTWGL